MRTKLHAIGFLTLAIFVYGGFYLGVKAFAKKPIVETLPMMKCASGGNVYILENYIVSGMDVTDTDRNMIFMVKKCGGYVR